MGGHLKIRFVIHHVNPLPELEEPYGHLEEPSWIRFVIHELNPLQELGGASTSEPLRGTTGTLERCLPIFATFRSCGNLKHILLFM